MRINRLVSLSFFLFISCFLLFMSSCGDGGGGGGGGGSGPCPKQGDGLGIGLHSTQIYDFDSTTVVTGPTANNNLIQWMYDPHYDSFEDKWIEGAFILGSSMIWGDTISSSPSLSMALACEMASGNEWDFVCSDDPTSYGAFWSNDLKSVYGEGDIFVVRLAEGVTFIKLQVTAIGEESPVSMEFYWEIF